MRVDERCDHGTRECPSCACVVAANENRCPICGYEFPNRPVGQRRWLAAIGLTLAGLLLAAALGLF